MSREVVAPQHGPVLWDPAQYGLFGAERARPFGELIARIPLAAPRRVADLGCGTGELTLLLARRWPEATIDAIDISPQMITAALSGADVRTDGQAGTALGGRVRFAVADVRDWRPARPVDLIVSNAVLHWVPGHEELLARWVDCLTAGGCLAFQVPGNHDAPSHTLLRELCRSARWRDRLADALPDRPVRDAAGYLDLLSGLGCAVDAWETTYLQVLGGPDPVLEWVKGTTLRPVLSLLDEEESGEFLAEYAKLLRRAYPPRPNGTVFPFRRIFVVARRLGNEAGTASSRAGPSP
ncbi:MULTISPECIES: trans-aconitate 2-methyltransferase [Thermomonospora]|uniref:Trans-aconitate 2-methyltransferase n=1 Tax=Thermomonospora curvata (strain ATCC 19995 / DSM 43183 / JCM 3096 / KCTC 9072 / NBRC 15933 / NCIMB 10081 / Henssen B9) TaxID=471852 RepID=D1A7I9_THECD|nr:MULTISPECIES: trans-aconitate 2-methyltransferase [Thermomonospora]ACY96578.1 Trans-aconitate 2-methyltransferase [Thermomonospora curvata DSM 43183]PKK15388.1 MAG: trans-aconitate methyltransferase [Thermomonospora sp. CIF 1]